MGSTNDTEQCAVWHPQVTRAGKPTAAESPQGERRSVGPRFDVVIVGAGSTGCVLAARLTEDPAVSVLLVEAGSTAPDDVADRLGTVDFSLTGRDWGFSATGANGLPVPYPQGRAAGGGSSVNGAVALRGMPDDYESWAGEGNPLWAWEDMLRCFRRSEADPIGGPWHGIDGPVPIRRWSRDELVAPQLAFLEACGQQGWSWTDDHNDPGATGVGSLPMNRSEGRRMSTAICYLRPVLDRPNLTVWGDATASRILVDGGSAVALEVRRARELLQVGGAELILCGGAINTPALLMRSGIGPAAASAALGIAPVLDLPGVGANLMEHPGSMVLVKPRPGSVDLEDLQFQLAVRYTSRPGAPANDVQLSMMNHWDLRPVPELHQVVGEDVVFAITCGLQAPRSRGRVTLTSADPDVAPTIDLSLLDDPDDARDLVDAVRRCRDVALSEALADRTASLAILDSSAFDDDEPVEAYVRNFCFPWYHASGTCRMGPDPAAGAVVDQRGRVHGIDGLRVFDASIMPTIPRANTNLSAIAIGERAAELLVGQ